MRIIEVQNMTSENEFIQNSETDFVADLTALCAIDSGSHNKAGVDRAADWIAARCDEWGWAVERLPQTGYGDLLTARLGGNGRGRIMLLGHMDTVYPDGTAAARPVRREGGKLLGPGVSDMKGGLLVGMYALRALQQSGFSDFEELCFFFNSEEEINSPVSKPLYLQEAARADAALVLEAARSNGDLVSARKGSGEYRLTVTGRSAHSGVEPEKGVNAIVELANRISAFQALSGIAPGVTVNVTLTGGGTASNAIPERAWAVFDARATDAAGAQQVHAALYALAAKASTLSGAQASLEGEFFFPPMSRTPATAFLAGLAKESARALNFEVGEAATGGASDASNIAARGIPVLDGLGPVGGMDHSVDEYIQRASLPDRIGLLSGLVRRILARQEELFGLRSR
jgi:glutamate carboxypeptidase